VNTKKQLIMLFSAWGVADAQVPKKGQRTLLSFPPSAQFRMITVEWTDKRATYGGKLYSATFHNDLLHGSGG
jgi:hypothetical protein